MKIIMEFNPGEIRTSILTGTLPALLDAVAPEEVAKDTAAPAVNEAPKTATKEKKENKPAPAVKEDPKPQEAPAPAAENDKAPEADRVAETETEVTYTLVQVREKLAALSRDGKPTEVKALLKKHGATTPKLSEVPEENYAALMKEAEGL